jgi:hypothetical protein
MKLYSLFRSAKKPFKFALLHNPVKIVYYYINKPNNSEIVI